MDSDNSVYDTMWRDLAGQSMLGKKDHYTYSLDDMASTDGKAWVEDEYTRYETLQASESRRARAASLLSSSSSSRLRRRRLHARPRGCGAVATADGRRKNDHLSRPESPPPARSATCSRRARSRATPISTART